MNAPTAIPAVEAGGSAMRALNIRQALGLNLFEVAMQGGIALSDRYGCWTVMVKSAPAPITRGDLEGGHRVAVDLVQSHARCLDAACRAALARAEKVAEHATSDAAHAALAEISDVIASALVGIQP